MKKWLDVGFGAIDHLSIRSGVVAIFLADRPQKIEEKCGEEMVINGFQGMFRQTFMRFEDVPSMKYGIITM